jgi:hypothetical protein
MLAKLSALKDKAAGLVDKAQLKAVGLLVESLHPKVHSVIDTRVDGFRDSTLEVGCHGLLLLLATAWSACANASTHLHCWCNWQLSCGFAVGRNPACMLCCFHHTKLAGSCIAAMIAERSNANSL